MLVSECYEKSSGDQRPKLARSAFGQAALKRASVCSKKTIFRSTIESSTKQLVKEACEDWLATAHRWLEPPIPIRSAFDGASKKEEEEEGSAYHELTHFSRWPSLPGCQPFQPNIE